MLSASSPIVFPPSSSPVGSKRNRPHRDEPAPKTRPAGPFEVDESEDEDAPRDGQHQSSNPIEDGDEPPSKRRITEASVNSPTRDPGGDGLPLEASDAHGLNLAAETETASQLSSLWSSSRPLFSSSFLRTVNRDKHTVQTCSGRSITIKERTTSAAPSYESLVAARSKTKEGRAKRAYYGIDIHELIAAAKLPPDEPPSNAPPSVEAPKVAGKKSRKTLLWTEKYRARNFMDLCGDDGTNRMVLRWLKRWDPVVFPGAVKPKPVIPGRSGPRAQTDEEEKPHKKILMLTGPPGLGKTTLAHVCAKQAGYDVLEINASDDRSRDVVKNQIRTSLGTESVKNVANRKGGNAKDTKVAKPACVVVDEVDGVVSGSSGSGEGGFVKALIDLVLTDQRNAAMPSDQSGARKKKKGDDFRLMRPLILICNDVYHPSLRPLRQSNLAEIIRVGRPTTEAVVGRLKAVYEKEGIPCDKDAARKLCEAAWGLANGIDAKKGAESTVEGDLRGVMVVGEWVASRFRSSALDAQRLTRQWIETNITNDLMSGAAGSRGLGRGSVKDIVSRLFMEGGGFPKQAMDFSKSKTAHEQPKMELGFSEQHKKYAMGRLKEMIDTSGEISYIMNEIFSEYPGREFNDDSYLSKPNAAYDWLHFHDTCQSRLYASQEWELAQYLSQPVLACHHLFASPKRHVPNMEFDKKWGQTADEAPVMPFTGPRADFQAHEAEKQNRAQLQAMQSQLSPSLSRSFRSPEDMATELLPYLVRLVTPDVKPVVVGGSQGSVASVRKDSEKKMVARAADVLAEVGIEVQKGKIEGDGTSRNPTWVYRLEPDLDTLAVFETGANLISTQAPVRYAVRQVLDQELQKTLAARQDQARKARFRAGGDITDELPTQHLPSDDKENAGIKDIKEAIKKDFFGRVVEAMPLAELDANATERKAKEERKVWVTYHEGLNNAVRKPMSLDEFLRAL